MYSVEISVTIEHQDSVESGVGLSKRCGGDDRTRTGDLLRDRQNLSGSAER